jgi:uncharacterized membrane protein
MATPSPSEEEALEEPGTGRLLALSDGVVAIALTLLVLQLKVPVPHGGNKTSPLTLYHDLAKGSPQLVSYVVSFYVFAIFWLIHHRVYRLLRGHREVIAWWNFGFLFTITLFPFSAALMGEFPDNSLAVVEFAINLLLANVVTTLVILVARRRELFVPEATPALIQGMISRGMAAAAVIVVSIPVAIVAPKYAPFVWLLLAVSPRLGERWGGSRLPA